MRSLNAVERACLTGARDLAEQGQLLGPGNKQGRAACRELERRGLLRLVGWAGRTVLSTKLYELTDAGRSELVKP